ncbi:hypothetical protein [Gordonia sp. NPDC003429]
MSPSATLYCLPPVLTIAYVAIEAVLLLIISGSWRGCRARALWVCASRCGPHGIELFSPGCSRFTPEGLSAGLENRASLPAQLEPAAEGDQTRLRDRSPSGQTRSHHVLAGQSSTGGPAGRPAVRRRGRRRTATGAVSVETGPKVVSGWAGAGLVTETTSGDVVVGDAARRTARRRRFTAPVSGTLDPVSGTLDAVSGTLDPVSGTLDPVSGTLDPVSGTLDPVSGTLDPVSGTLDAVSGTLDSVSGTLESVSWEWAAIARNIGCSDGLCVGAGLGSG